VGAPHGEAGQQGVEAGEAVPNGLGLVVGLSLGTPADCPPTWRVICGPAGVAMAAGAVLLAVAVGPADEAPVVELDGDGLVVGVSLGDGLPPGEPVGDGVGVAV